MHSLRKVFLLVAVLCMSAASFAQTSTTRISGTVYDPSGAVVGGVDVTLLNESTGVTQTQITNEVGLYAFPAIAAGTYTVTVEIPGFKTSKRTGIVLNVRKPAVQNFTPQVGRTTKTVHVRAPQVAVNPDFRTLGQNT